MVPLAKAKRPQRFDLIYGTYRDPVGLDENE
jgi:hypothetical protein